MSSLISFPRLCVYLYFTNFCLSTVILLSFYLSYSLYFFSYFLVHAFLFHLSLFKYCYLSLFVPYFLTIFVFSFFSPCSCSSFVCSSGFPPHCLRICMHPSHPELSNYVCNTLSLNTFYTGILLALVRIVPETKGTIRVMNEVIEF